MFKGNVPLTIERVTSYDDYGQIILSFVFRTKCLVVRLATSTIETPLRATASASHGNANEIISDAIILIAPSAQVEINDRLVLAGIQLRLSHKLPKFDVRGNLDHYQLQCDIWE